MSGSFSSGMILGGADDDILSVPMGVHPSLAGTSIFGDAGDDSITCDGAVGNVVKIYGGAGNDILRGGSGNDTIFANANEIGNDQVWGGDGADTIHFEAPDEVFAEFDVNDTYIAHDVIV